MFSVSLFPLLFFFSFFLVPFFSKSMKPFFLILSSLPLLPIHRYKIEGSFFNTKPVLDNSFVGRFLVKPSAKIKTIRFPFFPKISIDIGRVFLENPEKNAGFFSRVLKLVQMVSDDLRNHQF